MDLKKLDIEHVAIIMDGNGRWATEKNLDRTAGHAAGEHSLSRAIDWALDNNLRWLTVYAFSTENWSRSSEEVDFLMFFNRDILIRRREEFHKKGVKFKFIGDLKDKRIPDENKKLMKETEEITKHNNKLNLVFAFNYGSHKEIHHAVRKIAFGHYFYLKLSAWLFTKKHIEDNFKNYMYLPEMPNPDILIRTAGEKRLSNFLLYQLSYTELMFIDTLWPDFDEDDFYNIVEEYKKRVRKYGKA
ncbi:MAG: polyprenyl diphosphate synthase [Actinomycetota bacterium]|nr:polyprenyl diphosphate synthase [Actinomycetota bacterium]